MNTVRSLAKWMLRIIALHVVFVLSFVIGSMAVAGALPQVAASEPGLVPEAIGLLVIALANVLVVGALVLCSRSGGWKLALSLALVYYGAVTVLMQIDTWYFMSPDTVSPQLLVRLFVMGLAPALLFVPSAVWILGKGHAAAPPSPHPAPAMPVRQWAWKLATIAAAYLALYWGAGYFIAWQNPELRAFYGQPGEPLPFLAHTAHTLRDDPMLLPLQVLRALLWVLCALPLIRGSRVGAWWTALLVGLLFSVPQNVVHILANPLMPAASVRLSHLIETASSTFVFAAIVVWLLHREHRSVADLFGMRRAVG